MTNIDHTFGGRIQPQEDDKPEWDDLLDLPNKGMAFVYQRLSSHEQVKKHVYSVQAQDDLAQSAREDGYSDDQVYVENRDLGISGTEGKDERAGLAYMISQIQAGLVESVYVVDISRLFRDQTLINALTFGELCKEHNVIIVTPQMRLNLNDRMHMRIYRMEAERAAEELEIMHARLHGGQEIKARQGCYVGGSIPPGYVLDERKEIEYYGQILDNPNHHKYRVYEPHAKTIRKVFQLARVPGTTPTQIIRRCREEGVAFPPLPDDLASVGANVKSFCRSKKNPDGSWPLTLGRVKSILKNPAYIGWWIWAGEVVEEDNHPAILDEETFWAVQEISSRRLHRPRREHPPLPLSGLLYCGSHDMPRRMTYSNQESRGRGSIYQCRGDLQRIHCTIPAAYLDDPIGEAVISQCAYPEHAEAVLGRVAKEHNEVKQRRGRLEKQRQALRQQIDNLEHNFAELKLTPERASYIEGQIAKRRAQLRRLSNIRRAAPVSSGGRGITGEDVALVKRFLANLKEGWAGQPSKQKNVFFRLVLKKVVVKHYPNLIEATITWQTGLEQELLIHRPYRKPRQNWTEADEELLKEHYEDTPRDELNRLFPDRTWVQIRRKGNKLGLKRRLKAKPRGGNRYEPWEDELVREFFRGELTMFEVLDKLDGRTSDSVRSRLKALGLRHNYGSKPTWEWSEGTTLLKNGNPSVPMALSGAMRRSRSAAS